MLDSIDSNSEEWPQDFLRFSLNPEHKPLFIPTGLYFIKRHVWRVKMFHKTVHKTWNLFNLSKQSPENFNFRVLIGREFLSIFRSIECSFRSIEQESNNDRIIQKLQDYFLTISIDRAKDSNDRKCYILNFHLENSRTWIFTL